MAQYNHLPIFQSAYSLRLEIYQTTHHFSREYKYTLGQQLKEISAECLDFIILANSQEDKVSSLNEVRLRLEKLRIHIRLSCDLRIISLRKYEFFARSSEELSRQLSGWQDWALKKKVEK